MSGARAAFLRACRLDVEVRKPGNVSLASPGHGMTAAMFVASAEAAADGLFMPGAGVGARIEAAVEASWRAAGCNTNLGIVLLAAPLAAALEQPGAARDRAAWHAAVQRVLATTTVDDAAAAFRAIVRANPGGLGRAGDGDVHGPAALTLTSTMQLAAARDSIARQYAEGCADVFALAPAAVPAVDPAPVVLRVYLEFLGRWPDSHIVRKRGDAVAHSVMAAAQRWRGRADAGGDPALAAWDEALKAQGLNPGTSADLTVAALFVAGAAPAWHGT